MSRAKRMALIERDHDRLSIVRQCELAAISRSSLYYTPTDESAENARLMRIIDVQYMETPWYGSRQMARHLRRRGETVNRKRVRRLMRLMGLAGIGPQPRTSKPSPAHPVYPYLLRDVPITRVDQVWCTDVTYIPMARGFVYLVAIMDWYSRRVLSWKLSNTLEAEFCVDALQQAIRTYGRPEIFNSDQGCQFTSTEFTGVLADHKIRISMDGKGRWMDNVFIERLWRSLKYECVYLQAFESPNDAEDQINNWLIYYNHERPHSSLEDRTPAEAYRGVKPLAQAA